MRSSLLGGLFLAAALLAPGLAAADPTIIYLVRHGEKAAVEKDPELTTQGKARARNIAAILKSTGIAHVYSSTAQRTRQTAQPLATDLGLQVQVYDPAQSANLVAQVKAAGGTALVVGHSNTVPELVRLFGGKPGSDIGDDEFDRLYQLIVDKDGSVTTVLLHSVAP
ncbi:SixA phosphatase family protein [Massilia pseudoviolaceinigra]|uniref:SixA phosphatase family protein n=1 Tax=Massilia pseudoviolaceinigra TaxID=3057165 RepID=UPI0027967784|nr:phosphoglycerate mutase family protein [Massilia sp. CCM 9206]MDQ1921755.1 phosphoglycerate mutase family protein [Massilia sp. CCM 9206]